MKKHLLFFLPFVISCFISLNLFSQASIGPIFTTDPTCFGNADGSASVNINQTSPLTNLKIQIFIQNPNNGVWAPQGTSYGQNNAFNFTSLADGFYRVVLTDTATGANLGQSFFPINNPPQLSLSVSTVDVSCFGSSDGSAFDSHSRGRGIYTSHLHLFFF